MSQILTYVEIDLFCCACWWIWGWISAAARGAHIPLWLPSCQDGGKERPADIHPLLLPSAPAHPTVQKPWILGNFSIPRNKAGVLPTHISEFYFLSLKQLLPLKAGCLTKTLKWDLLFQAVFQRQNTCEHVGGQTSAQAEAPRKRTHIKPIISSQCNFLRTGRDLG